MYLRWITLSAMLLLPAALLCVTPKAQTAVTTASLTEQKDKQKEIKVETDRLVRRIQTMIRVLEYNRLGKTAEKDLLDQVRGTLAGLSKEQMTALIAALEKARAATGDAQGEQLKAARERHEEIVLVLKGVLAKFDAVKSLEQASDRLEKLSRDQVELFLRTVQATYEAEQIPQAAAGSPDLRLPRRAGRRRGLHPQGLHRSAGPDRQAHEQAACRPDGPRGARQRTGQERQDGAAVRRRRPPDSRPWGRRATSSAAWKKAAGLQWQASGKLYDMARMLRPAPDRVAVLREARQRLEKAIEEQTNLRADVVNPAPKREGGDKVVEDPTVGRRGNRGGRGVIDRGMAEEKIAPAVIRGKELGDRQGWLEHDTRCTRQGMLFHLKELAAKLEPAEKLMYQAQTDLRFAREGGRRGYELAGRCAGPAARGEGGAGSPPDRGAEDAERSAGKPQEQPGEGRSADQRAEGTSRQDRGEDQGQPATSCPRTRRSRRNWPGKPRP